MTTILRSVNAWILLDEDEPAGTSYQSPTSCYQSLINLGIYQATDMLCICFFNTIPTGATTIPSGDGSSYTLQIGNVGVKHPDGSTTGQYLSWVISDARRLNPQIKLLATLGYGSGELRNIFSNTRKTPTQNAQAFAANLLSYLQSYDLDGFDIDWEAPLDASISREQFAMLFTAVRAAFDTAPDRHYYLTLSPATAQNLDPSTVNACFDFINLQLYSGFTSPEPFLRIGIRRDLLAYGAKFESIGPNNPSPYQDANNASAGYQAGHYNIVTQWRLNSGNYQFEQAEQVLLYQLVYGSTGPQFDDTRIVAAAGNPPITQLVIRFGEVLDAIQATNTGNFSDVPLSYRLPQHGGNGGTATKVDIPEGDAITEISGYSGVWFGWSCVLQITLKTRAGRIFGPFGNMEHTSSRSPFRLTAPAGQAIVAFRGSVVNVPESSGGTCQIIASLEAASTPP